LDFDAVAFAATIGIFKGNLSSKFMIVNKTAPCSTMLEGRAASEEGDVHSRVFP